MKLRALQLAKIKKGTRILMRVDCNVPVQNRHVEAQSAWRLEQTLSDIVAYQKRGAIIIIAGHLGRPDGEVKLSLSLKPIARWYEQKLNTRVELIKDPTSLSAVDKIKSLLPGSVVLLENLRFFPGEEANGSRFAKALSKLADVYVNNAFGVCHRKHASVYAITKYLPGYAGSILINESAKLGAKRNHPFVFILGGVKLETKMPTLLRLGKEADTILVGGGVAIAMSATQQKKVLQIKNQNFSRSELSLAKLAIKKFKKKLILPVDFVCVRDRKTQNILSGHVVTTDQILDVGSATIKLFASSMKSAKTIVFNGAMGSLQSGAQAGTADIAKALPITNQKQAIVGGGDTVGFLQGKELLNHFSFVSTGGGAMLAFLAGEKLPGLEALKIK
ncbi:MAG: phosphoglycerate kinase [Patescibacteria group bacterium]